MPTIAGYLPIIQTPAGPTALIPTADGVLYNTETTLAEKLETMDANNLALNQRLIAIEQGGGGSGGGGGEPIETVLAPIILSPVQGATVYANAVTIVTSNMACGTGVADTHANTDYKITADSAGINTIASLPAIPGVTCTFENLPVTEDGLVYLWARHRGVVFGAGPWTKIAVMLRKGVLTPGGRVLYRHSNGKGTVMEFNDGLPRKVLVLDAVYRGLAVFGTYGTDSSLPNYNTTLSHGGWYINTSNTPNANATTVMTDEMVNTICKAATDINTSKKACDTWMTYGGTAAVRFCRNIMVEGHACDLPNLQIGMRIFLEADLIDKLDSTALANPTKSLGKGNSGGHFGCMGTGEAWSCTEAHHESMRGIGSNSDCSTLNKSTSKFCIPILEL